MNIVFYLFVIFNLQVLPLQFDVNEQVPISDAEQNLRLKKMQSIPVEFSDSTNLTLGDLIHKVNLELKRHQQAYTIKLYMPGTNLYAVLNQNINEKNLGYSKELLIKKLAKSNCLEILNIVQNSAFYGVSFWKNSVVIGDIGSEY